ncbi:MAG: hypothetical protein U9Q06_03060 [Nanoarchaeota archaeon]|nr:hypothetical protein [Nanoarchaeota archaeon]
MNKKLVVVGLFAIMFCTIASAEIFLSKQPNQLYTLGEDLEIELGSDGEEGWATIELICQNKTKLLFFNFLLEEDKEKELKFPLTKSFLRGLNGECHLALSYNDEVKQSMTFKIQDQIYVDMNFNALSFEPNTTIKFTGTARKPNSEAVNGFAEVSIKGTELEIILPINKNKFKGELKLPKNIAPGDYFIEVFSYEKEGDEITNNGIENFSMEILQKPMRMEIQVEGEVMPGEELEFSAFLYDQADQTIDGEQVTFLLRDSTGEMELNILSKTGEISYYTVRKNMPVGYMNVSAEAMEVSEKTEVYVRENEEALFNLANGTLVIRNIGNIEYNKYVEIAIGNHSEIKNLSLAVSKSIEFELSAPEGEYKILIKDDSQEIGGLMLLTGKSISIKNRRGFGFDRNLVAWLFIIAVVGMFVFVSSKRVLQKKNVSIKSFISHKKKSKDFSEKGVVKVSPMNEGSKQVEREGIADHSLVIDGDKQNSTMLALKIKNSGEIKQKGSNAQANIDEAINLISENNGKVYKAGDYVVGIFAPVVTRTFDNSLIALKTASEITEKLKEHNKKYTHKIKFGIGVNAGDVVAKKEQGKLFFTPLGNVLTNVRSIAEIAENDFLVGESVSKQVGSKAKFVSYPAKFGLKTMAVKEIVDRRENSKFINAFLDRNQEYKKLNDFRKD